MGIYIESLMTPLSFLSFEIGNKLDLSSYSIEDDYNPIGHDGAAYYFFNKEIDVELFERSGLISSFDILLKNQENDIYLGSNEKNNLLLNSCSVCDLISYLVKNKLEWKFEKIVADKSISIAYYSKLKMSFYFDCDSENSLSLIGVSKL